jgi:starvation-inducible DNA-binding protein
MDSLIQLLFTAFANNFAFYLKSHQFHWAVMGKDFPQYHKVLEKIYTDAQESIDAYAEELRRLGQFPQGDLADIIDMSEIVSAPADASKTDPQEMFLILLADLEQIVTTLQDTFDASTGQREYGLQNFLADRISLHRKSQWMLTAIVTPCVEYQADNITYPSHTMINPDSGETVEVTTPDEHTAAIDAGYTEETPPYSEGA